MGDTNEDKVPPRVPNTVHELIALGGIKGIRVEYRQTGVDSADTYWVITGWEPGYNKTAPQAEFVDYEVKKYLEIAPDHATIAHVKREWADKYHARNEYEKKHAAELAEYSRLQKKFGDAA